MRTGTRWTQQAYLKASNTEAGDRFGFPVAISGDTVVVGAYLEDSATTGVNGNQADNSAPDSGAAYVFGRTGTTWTQQAYLKESNTDPGDRFGCSVAISDNTIVVGAIGEASASTGVNGNQSDNTVPYSGAAYVFVRSDGSWTQQAYFKSSNPEEAGDFGQVAISGDTIVVGANEEAFTSGAAYVFVRSRGRWTQQAYLKALDTERGDLFGSELAISGDTIVVTAIGKFGFSGAAYIFVYNGGSWTQRAYLRALNAEEGDLFGSGVAMSGDTIVFGANGESSAAIGVNGNESDDTAPDSGAAYLLIFRTAYDFNHDNRADFVLYNEGARRTAVWYMNSNALLAGVFGPTLPNSWNLVAVADFNDDGQPDYALFDATTQRTAIWYLVGPNYAHGSYGPSLPSGWELVTVGDFNGDNNPDYVLFNATTHRTAIWYLNNNLYVNSAFGPTLPANWKVVGVADFNGDGKSDYLLFNPVTHQSAIWYLSGPNYVTGAFGPMIPPGYNLTGAGDLNGDSKSDYVLFNPTTRRTAIWYLNNNSFAGGVYGPTLPPGWTVVAP